MKEGNLADQREENLFSCLSWDGWACCSPPQEGIPYRQSLYYCFVLMMVNILGQADQWSLPTLQASGLQCSSCTQNESFYEKCREMCLNLNDVDMGFLSGPTLSLSSLLVMFPLGWLADRYSRVRLLAIGLFVWTLCTFAASFVQNFWQFAVVRIGLGLGQATVNPTAYSLLSDYFSPHHRTFVLALFGAMVFVGEDIGLLMGILSQHSSWRICFIVLGTPGFVVSLMLFFTVHDPVRGQGDRLALEPDPHECCCKGKESIMQDSELQPLSSSIRPPLPYSDDLFGQLKILFQLKPFVSLWITVALRYLSGYALGGWMQVFYRRVYGLSPQVISSFMAVIIPLGGLSSAAVGAWAADKFGKDNPSNKSWVCVVSSVGGAIFMVAMLTVQTNYWISFLMMLFSYFFAESWTGPSISIVHDLVHPKMRSLSTSVFYLTVGIGSLATVIVGALNRYFGIPSSRVHEPDAFDPTPSLLIMVAGVYSLCGIGYTVTAILIRYHMEGK
eukprot:TRINITY_DN3421_c0_g1_i6.p1 TRINITY_DN3421_c0_g1~~TRINITY_DN3421_c0_g1_i6.p1  ORF type:complete len:502 (+),score=73.78 TRINITY_DN3421_c0_g1_i6:960-2465(+)